MLHSLITTAQNTANSKGYVASGTYRGSGGSTSEYKTLALPFVPSLLIIFSAANTTDNSGYIAILSRNGLGGLFTISRTASPIFYMIANLSSTTVRWKYYNNGGLAHLNMDTSGETYMYTALG